MKGFIRQRADSGELRCISAAIRCDRDAALNGAKTHAARRVDLDE